MIVQPGPGANADAATLEDARPMRCAAIIYKRDTYRVSRGSTSGFSMHYDRCQCRREAKTADGLCTQHDRSPYRHLWVKSTTPPEDAHD